MAEGRKYRDKINDATLKARVKERRERIRQEESSLPSSSACTREIGAYADADKLTFLRKYLYVYAYIISNNFPRMWYVETCAGPGVGRVRGSGRLVLGSPLLAMTNEPYFHGFRFIEADHDCAEALRERAGRYAPGLDVMVIEGDCNSQSPRAIQDIPNDDHFLAFLDPEGLELKWETSIVPLAERPNSELYINFTFDMAIKRNIAPTQSPGHELAVTEYMGTDAWKDLRDAYYEERISFDQLREGFLGLYEDGLKEFGFQHFAVSKIVRSDNNQPLYYLLSASRVGVAKKTMDQVMKVRRGYQAALFDDES
jgi:three-Cys-motif partner protein